MDRVAPTVPENVAATWLGLSQVGLTWLPSTDNVAVGSYRVYESVQDTNGARWWRLVARPVDDESATILLRHEGPAMYAVTAVDTSGNESPKSVPVEVHQP
jgi:hypothetical protein